MYFFFFYVGVVLIFIVMVLCINLIGNFMIYVEVYQFSLVVILVFYFWIIGNCYVVFKYYYFEFRCVSGIFILWLVELF